MPDIWVLSKFYLFRKLFLSAFMDVGWLWLMAAEKNPDPVLTISGDGNKIAEKCGDVEGCAAALFVISCCCRSQITGRGDIRTDHLHRSEGGIIIR